MLDNYIILHYKIFYKSVYTDFYLFIFFCHEMFCTVKGLWHLTLLSRSDYYYS